MRKLAFVTIKSVIRLWIDNERNIVIADFLEASIEKTVDFCQEPARIGDLQDKAVIMPSDPNWLYAKICTSKLPRVNETGVYNNYIANSQWARTSGRVDGATAKADQQVGLEILCTYIHLVKV